MSIHYFANRVTQSLFGDIVPKEWKDRGSGKHTIVRSDFPPQVSHVLS